MLDQLAAAVGRHRNGLWSGTTAVPRLTVVALDDVVNPLSLRYEPMVCFIAEGAKRTVTGERSRLARRGDMFLNSLDLPVTAVFEEVPYRSVVLHLDGPALADLLLELDGGDPAVPVAGQVSATMSPELVDAVTRWVRLLDTPEDIRPLAARDDRVLLARRANTGYADGQWNLPSGKLEHGEDLVAAAIREAREEVAVELERAATPLATTVHYLNPEGEARIGFVFRPSRWSSEPRNAEPHKCSELDWFPVDALPPRTVPYSRAAVEQTLRSTPFGLEGWPTAMSTTSAGR